MKKAYVFPGQGSQFPGMAKALYDTNATAKEMLEKANEILGFRITDIMFDGTPEDLKAKDLTQDQIAAITKILQNDIVVEGDLRRMIAADIRRLQQINCYRGIRHRRNLPVHGQRTKTNARTRKGKKVTIGAIRDKTQRRLAAKG